MATQTRSTHAEATETFSGDIVTKKGKGDAPDEKIAVTVSRGTLLPADDDVVKAFPNYFREPTGSRPGVEAATAAPGEKRGA